MKAINFRAVPIVKYEAGIVDSVKEELEVMDRKTRKLMTIYRASHLLADVDQLYFKKSEREHGMISIEECQVKKL